MKKILLTTTALTLLAGAAVAEVSVSGSSRMGISSTGGTTTTAYRTRINFTMSGETDGGLTFGAFSRVNLSSGSTGVFSGSRVWISNGMATLTIGNAGGATATNGGIFGCGVGYTGSCVDMASSLFSWNSFSSGGGGANLVRLDFALGSANVSISGGNTNDIEVAASFALGAANVAVSHDTGSASATTPANSALAGGTQVTVDFDAGSANVGLNYAVDAFSGLAGYTASVSYAMGAGSLYVYAGNAIGDVDAVAATVTVGQQTVFGASYSMGLGGGATGVVAVRSTGGTVTTDAGIKFSF